MAQARWPFALLLFFWLGNLVRIDCNRNSIEQMKQAIMSDPAAKEQLMQMLKANGISEEAVNKIMEPGVIEGLIVLKECDAEMYVPGAPPDGERSGSKTYCCVRLAALACILSKSKEPMTDVTRIDSLNCETYLIEPSLCDLHLSNLERVQLQSLACYNHVIHRLGRNLEKCCVQNFQSKCFAHNFADECNQSMANVGIENCAKVALIEPQCSGIQGCPGYSVQSLRDSFFASKYFFASVILFTLLFAFVFFLCRQCNKPDTSFEIDCDKADASRKTTEKRRKNRKESANKKKRKKEKK